MRKNILLKIFAGAVALLLLFLSCLAVMALLVAAVIAAAAGGSAHAEYTPVLDIAPISGKNAAGLIAYCAFVLLPAALRIREDIKWHSLRSGI